MSHGIEYTRPPRIRIVHSVGADHAIVADFDLAPSLVCTDGRMTTLSALQSDTLCPICNRLVTITAVEAMTFLRVFAAGGGACRFIPFVKEI